MGVSWKSESTSKSFPCLLIGAMWIGMLVGCGSDKGAEFCGVDEGVPMGISLTFPRRVRETVVRVEALLETDEESVRVELSISDTTAAMEWCAPIGTTYLTLSLYDANDEVRYVGRRVYPVSSCMDRIQADFSLFVADVTFRLTFPMDALLEAYRTEIRGRFDVVDDGQRLTICSIPGHLERMDDGAYMKTVFVRDVPAGGRLFSAFFYGEGDRLLFRGGCTVQIQKNSEMEVRIDMESVQRGEAKKLRERERSA